MTIRIEENTRGIWDSQCRTVFATVHTFKREPIFRDRRLAGLMVDALRWLSGTGDCVVHSWVVMPDHVHLLLSLPTGGDGLDNSHLQPERMLDKLKVFPAQRISRLVFRTNIWDNDDQIDPIDDEVEFFRHMLYILENPRCAGLVKSCSEYPYLEVPERCMLQEGLLDVDEALVP